MKEDFSRYLEIVLQIVFDVISVYLSGFHLILECHFINFNLEKGETSEISSLGRISSCRIISPDGVTFLRGKRNRTMLTVKPLCQAFI